MSRSVPANLDVIAALSTFGELLRYLRQRDQLTQRDLAVATGYSISQISRLEHNERLPDELTLLSVFVPALGLEQEPATIARLLALARHGHSGAAASLAPPPEPNRETANPPSPFLSQVDWGEAPDVSGFQGRQAELVQLRSWLVDERCRLVTVLGMGGLGKTALATTLASQVGHAFAAVVWRSLRNAPPIEELLGQCIQVVSNHKAQELPPGVDKRITLLMDYLRQQRFLLVLDNFETVLQSERTGHYLSGCEGYGQLLQRLGEGRHQSCLLLTSREKPKEVTPLTGVTAPVRTLYLTSLQPVDGRALLQDKGLSGSDREWAALHARYSGNPLALKIVAETIYEIFDGKIGPFLREETALFGDIGDLLAQQIARLIPIEQELLYWLAVEREPISDEELRADLVKPPPKLAVLEALRSLRQRSLVERTETGFTLQNVVLEYLTAQLIEHVCDELTSGQLVLFLRYALLKAQAKIYVRESQHRLILMPVVERLVERVGKAEVVERLTTVLTQLRQEQPHQPGYAGGNLLNLLVELQSQLRGLDFSQLAVWQADLRGVEAQDMNLRQVDLSGNVFTDTFAMVLAVDFSPDSERLAVGSSTNDVRVWRSKDGQPLLTCLGHTGLVRSVCFSPDGNMLASGSFDQTIRLWNAHSGHWLATLQGHTQNVESVCFSPNGKLLASGSGDQTVRLWAIHTGQCVNTLRGHTGRITTVCFSPDGKFLASCSGDQTVRLWNVHTAQCVNTLLVHAGCAKSVCFSPDGKLLATGGDDRLVRLWEVSATLNSSSGSRHCLYTLQGHSDEVFSVCFSPDSKLLASGSRDQTVRLWDSYSGRCLHTLHGHTNEVWSVCFSPNGTLLASGGLDQSVRLWDSRSSLDVGQCLHILQGYSSGICSVRFSPDNNSLVSGSADQAIRLWQMDSGQCQATLHGHTGWVWSVCFNPDGRLLASGSTDQTVRLWEVYSGRCLTTLHGHTGQVRSVCFAPDGKLLASGSEDRTVRLWDVSAVLNTNSRSCQCLHVLQGHTGHIYAICLSPVGNLLASGSTDQTVRLWDSHTGQCLHTLYGHTDAIFSVCFSSDGRLLATGSSDQTVRLWDSGLPLGANQCLRTLHGHTDWVYSLCFSPDGRLLASGSMDQTIRLWEVHSGRCLTTLHGHTNAIFSVAFNDDGTLLASGSIDETIKFWDIQTGTCLQTLRSERPYERMNITCVRGLTEAQRATLKVLGAVDGAVG